MNERHHPRGGGFGPAHHRLGLLVVVLVVLALAALTAYLVTRWSHGHLTASPAPAYAPPDRALDAARLRYANGELTREAYLQIVGDLGGRPVDPPPPPSP